MKKPTRPGSGYQKKMEKRVQELEEALFIIQEEATHCLCTRPNSGEWRNSMQNIVNASHGKIDDQIRKAARVLLDKKDDER